MYPAAASAAKSAAAAAASAAAVAAEANFRLHRDLFTLTAQLFENPALCQQSSEKVQLTRPFMRE